MRLRALVLVFSVTALLVSAQAAAPSEVEITAEPSHHLVLQNSYVRVFKVEVAPGSATLMHRHRHDYVYVVLGSAQITNEAAGKPAIPLRLSDGETQFMNGGFSHVMRDQAGTPFRNVTVELLKDEELRSAKPPKWDQERGMSILNGGTRDILFVKDGVRVSEIQLQPSGIVPRHTHLGPHLIIAVSDLQLQSDAAKTGVKPVNLKAGEVLWVPGRLTHTLKNLGKQNVKFITIEFP